MEEIQIKVTRLRLTEGNGAVRAFADIEIGNAIAVHGLRIVEGAKGPFLAWPSRKVEGEGEDKYYDIVHPVTARARSLTQNAVLDEYKREIELQASRGR